LAFGAFSDDFRALAPKYTQEKTNLTVFVEANVPFFKKMSVLSPWMRDVSDFAIDLIVAQDPITGTGGLAKKLLKRVGYRLLHQPNEAFRELKATEPKFWTPKAAWVR
jgi:hypothetical protein